MIDLKNISKNKKYIITFKNQLVNFSKNSGIPVTFSSNSKSGEETLFQFTTIQAGYYNLLAEESKYGIDWELEDLVNSNKSEEVWDLKLQDREGL